MRKRLVSLVCVFVVFWVLALNGAFGKSIQWSETIKLDPEAKFQVPPTSFCITEDKLFLFPDLQNGTIKVFEKVGNFLKFLRAFNSGNELFIQPRYFFYSQDGRLFGVIDYGVRKGFILNRCGKVAFEPIKTFECRKFGYDIKFAGDGIQTIVSGYITDSGSNPFDLYSVNIETRQIDYLLPSYLKFGMRAHEEYIEEYFKKQTLPAIGIKGFFDIQADGLFFVWEGALRIIKLDLPSKEIIRVFGQETPYYTKPDGTRLSEPYIKGEFQITWKLQESFSYVRNIFVTSQNVFVVYETGKMNEGEVSTFRLQIYTLGGEFLNDLLIPNNPGRQMSFDKANNELYALTNVSSTGKGELAILRYKLSR